MPVSKTPANGSCAFLATMQAILNLKRVPKHIQAVLERLMRWLAANGLETNAAEYTAFIAIDDDDDCLDVPAAQAAKHAAFVQSIRQGAYGDGFVLRELASALVVNICVRRYRRRSATKVERTPTHSETYECGVAGAPSIALKLVSYDLADDCNNNAAHYSAFIDRNTQLSNAELTSAIQRLIQHLVANGKQLAADVIKTLVLAEMKKPLVQPALHHPRASSQRATKRSRDVDVPLRRSTRVRKKPRRYEQSFP